MLKSTVPGSRRPSFRTSNAIHPYLHIIQHGRDSSGCNKPSPPIQYRCVYDGRKILPASGYRAVFLGNVSNRPPRESSPLPEETRARHANDQASARTASHATVTWPDKMRPNPTMTSPPRDQSKPPHFHVRIALAHETPRYPSPTPALHDVNGQDTLSSD